jgi:transcriptional regulator with XRE-family HTH domain
LCLSAFRCIVVSTCLLSTRQLYTELGIYVNTEKSVFMKNFSERLESLRRDLTQKQMASRIGVPLNTYTNWVRNVNVPKSDQLEKICTVFGVSSDWLLGLSTAPPPIDKQCLAAGEIVGSSPECLPCKKKDAEINRLNKIIDKLVSR